jgi:hypothetical protein
MVDAAQVLIAIFDGSSGGTGNCVKYVQSKKGCNIIVYSGPYEKASKRTPINKTNPNNTMVINLRTKVISSSRLLSSLTSSASFFLRLIL